MVADMKSFLRALFFAGIVAGLSATEPRLEFWQRLQALCGQAFEGQMVEGTAASDSAFRGQRIIMHVRLCNENEIRIPFFVGENRSRTWVLTRTTEGLRLKHDHRHEDGTEDAVTQYGGDTAAAGTATKQEFLADEFTGTLIPAAKGNIWTLQIEEGKMFAYALRREAEGRRFRVEFDLNKPVAAPPPPWGSEDK